MILTKMICVVDCFIDCSLIDDNNTENFLNK